MDDLQGPPVGMPAPGVRTEHGAVNLDIEFLRSVAIIFVIIQHGAGALYPWPMPTLAQVMNYFRPASGVDLFFAISGFVITRSLLREDIRSAGFAAFAVPFWTRRVFRIWPSAWLWASLILAASFALPTWSFGAPPYVFYDWVATMMQVANLHSYDCALAGNCGSAPFTVFWSLSLEEQFYIGFPFLLFFLPRRWLMPVVIAGILLQLPLHRPQMPPTPILWYVRSDALLLGVLIALCKGRAVYQALDPGWLRRRVLAYPAVGLLLLLLAAAPVEAVADVATGLTALVAGALVLLASYDRGYLIRLSPWRALTRWIGTRSYALYLVHLPSFYLARGFWSIGATPVHPFDRRTALGLTLTVLVLAVALAEANHRLIEQPLRRYGRRAANEIGARLIAVQRSMRT